MNAQPPARISWLPYAVGIVGAFLIMGLLVWAMVHYTRPAPVGQARAQERKQALAGIRSAEAKALDTYEMLDPAKGVVRLPIARAMELTLQEYQNPAAARSNLTARAEKAAAPAPQAPPPPNPYE